MFFIIDVCFFVMWFGAWSSCHGWGAVGSAALWTLLMGLCCFCEIYGRERGLWKPILTRFPVSFALLWIALWAVYFLGLGDWVRVLLPKSFPEGGVIHSWSQCGILQVIALLAWGAVRIRSMIFFIRCRQMASAEVKSQEEMEKKLRIVDILVRVGKSLCDMFG